MKNNSATTLEILEKRKKSVSNLISTRTYTDPALIDKQDRINSSIANYLEELEEVIEIVSSTDKDSLFSFVSFETFEKEEKKADFCSIEFDGMYLRIEEVLNIDANRLKKSFYIYAFPISKLTNS